MLNRFNVILDDYVNGPLTSEVFASRDGIATVELAADCYEQYAVRVTPMPAFDPSSDYLVRVVRKGSYVDTQLLAGTMPSWAELPHGPVPHSQYAEPENTGRVRIAGPKARR